MRILFYKFTILFFILLIILPINLQAQEEQFEMEILSFEEMMNSVVVTASKEVQKKSDAPAIIDVITELQLKDMNAQNLYEVISLLPGVEMMETYFGRTVLNFRGIQNVHYTNKVLLMINGNPLYEWVNGSYFLENIPINSVSRIEVIRGPGSSLYGTNAYSGVINVITKNGTGESHSSIDLGYGSHQTVAAEFQTSSKISETSSVFIAGTFENSTGYEFNGNADEKGREVELDYYTKPFNIYANYKNKNLFIDLGFMNLKKSVYGLTPNIDYSGDAINKNFFANAKLTHEFSEKVSSSFYLRYSKYTNPEINIGYFPFKGFPGHDPSTVYLESGSNFLSAEAQFNIRLTDELTNVSGIAYEKYNSDPYTFKYDSDDALSPFSAYTVKQSSNSLAGYSQFSYKASSSINFVGGIRVVKDADVDDLFFAPRAGIIFNVDRKYYFKLLYGKAFRTPSFFEKYVSTTNVLFGSKDLLPEEIQTLDLGFEADFSENLNGRINAFYQTTSDGLVRIPTNNPTEHGANAAIYSNTSELEIYGLEFALNGILGNTTYYGINGSWKSGKDKNTDKDLTGIAEILANGWLSYRFSSFVVTPYLQFIGSRKGNSSRLVNGSAVGAFELDSYILANLAVSYKYDRFNISGVLKNLLDTDYNYVEYVRQRSEEVPGGPGLNYFVKVAYEF